MQQYHAVIGKEDLARLVFDQQAPPFSYNQNEATVTPAPAQTPMKLVSCSANEDTDGREECVVTVSRRVSNGVNESIKVWWNYV